MTQLNAAVEAEYADGYIHNETALQDTSPYQDGKNTFYDILEKRPEAEHGPLVRFSVYFDQYRYDIDWTKLPASARPIRFRHMERPFDPSSGWTGDPICVSADYGYQFNDETGTNQQFVWRLPE